MNTAIPVILLHTPSLAPHLFAFDCSNASKFNSDFEALCQTYPLFKQKIDNELKNLLDKKTQQAFEEMKQHVISHSPSTPIVTAGLRKMGFKVIEHQKKTLYIPLYLLAKMHAQQDPSLEDLSWFSHKVDKHQKKREEQFKQKMLEVAAKLGYCFASIELCDVKRKYALLKKDQESKDALHSRVQDKYDDLLKEYNLTVQEAARAEKENEQLNAALQSIKKEGDSAQELIIRLEKEISELKAKLDEQLIHAVTDSNPHSSQGKVESVEKKKFV